MLAPVLIKYVLAGLPLTSAVRVTIVIPNIAAIGTIKKGGVATERSMKLNQQTLQGNTIDTIGDMKRKGEITVTVTVRTLIVAEDIVMLRGGHRAITTLKRLMYMVVIATQPTNIA